MWNRISNIIIGMIIGALLFGAVYAHATKNTASSIVPEDIEGVRLWIEEETRTLWREIRDHETRLVAGGL